VLSSSADSVFDQAPSVAINASGDLVAAWAGEGAGGRMRLWSVVGRASGEFERPQLLSADGRPTASVAIDATGRAIAAWVGGPTGRAMYAVRPAGRRFGRPRFLGLAPPNERSSDEEVFVAAGANRFALAWRGYVGRVNAGGQRMPGLTNAVAVRVSDPATGRLGRTVVLGRGSLGGGEPWIRPLSVSDAGAVLVQWASFAGSSQALVVRRLLATRTVGGGAFESVQLPDPVERPDGYQNRVVLISAPGGRMAALLDRTERSGESPGPTLPPAISRFGPSGFSAPVLAPAANPHLSAAAAAAFGVAEEVFVAWVDQPRRAFPQADVGPLRLAVLDAAGSFSRNTLLSTGLSRGPMAARLGDGRVLFLWSAGGDRAVGGRYRAALVDQAGEPAAIPAPSGRPALDWYGSHYRELAATGDYAALIWEEFHRRRSSAAPPQGRVLISVGRF